MKSSRLQHILQCIFFHIKHIVSTTLFSLWLAETNKPHVHEGRGLCFFYFVSVATKILIHNKGAIDATLTPSFIYSTTNAISDIYWEHVMGKPAMQETRVRSWVGKILWRRKWQPTPVSLPGKSHGQRSLVGYSPWGCKELVTAEQLIHNGQGTVYEEKKVLLDQARGHSSF